ncbi:hypothetical protein AL755_15045 [Arthrobacter sp. ERGS1:01]|uniref:hypothetical protein n=1 Tax=Arthrobacter sp. ERGS1:01 TaxID=1704044 RepID=UPI0006B4823B|nr:hypothetical protein [Arthrobacter sp. ERGS1:01]ALE06470.1 hypothetical protein AL755_15045 [Arthrobacter sp. ERGS1:01]
MSDSGAPASLPAASTALARGVRRGEFVAAAALLAQYLLGMVDNLFVTIPDQHPGAKAGEYFGGVAAGIGWALSDGGPWLALHAGLGLALVVVGIGLVVQTARMGDRRHLVLTAVAALFILGAGFNGASFINYGLDVSSLIMAILWALAMACYLLLLYLPGPGQTRPARRRN